MQAENRLSHRGNSGHGYFRVHEKVHTILAPSGPAIVCGTSEPVPISVSHGGDNLDESGLGYRAGPTCFLGSTDCFAAGRGHRALPGNGLAGCVLDPALDLPRVALNFFGRERRESLSLAELTYAQTLTTGLPPHIVHGLLIVLSFVWGSFHRKRKGSLADSLRDWRKSHGSMRRFVYSPISRLHSPHNRVRDSRESLGADGFDSPQ